MAEAKTYEQKPRAMKPMRGRGMPVPKGAIKKGTISRLIKTLFKYYKWQVFLILFCILFSSVGGLVSSVYMQLLVDEVITPALTDYGGLTAELQGTLIGSSCCPRFVIRASARSLRRECYTICARICSRKCKPCPLNISTPTPTAKL